VLTFEKELHFFYGDSSEEEGMDFISFVHLFQHDLSLNFQLDCQNELKDWQRTLYATSVL
jgi:hypothetical protein